MTVYDVRKTKIVVDRTISKVDGIDYKTTSMTVRLSRGGPMWTRYDELSPTDKKEWDLYEDLLEQLGKGRHLYVSGHFNGIPSHACQYPIRKRRRKNWSGAWRITSRSELHGIFVENSQEYYGFFVAYSELAEDEILNIAKVHYTTGEQMCDITSINKGIFCGIEECIDRDWFGLICNEKEEQVILDLIKNVLREVSIEYVNGNGST